MPLITTVRIDDEYVTLLSLTLICDRYSNSFVSILENIFEVAHAYRLASRLGCLRCPNVNKEMNLAIGISIGYPSSCLIFSLGSCSSIQNPIIKKI